MITIVHSALPMAYISDSGNGSNCTKTLLNNNKKIPYNYIARVHLGQNFVIANNQGNVSE